MLLSVPFLHLPIEAFIVSEYIDEDPILKVVSNLPFVKKYMVEPFLDMALWTHLFIIGVLSKDWVELDIIHELPLVDILQLINPSVIFLIKPNVAVDADVVWLYIAPTDVYEESKTYSYQM